MEPLDYNNFTNLYSLSKTLRFELKPIGETADYIEDFKSQNLKDFVTEDQQRAEDYKAIKELIDDYHRAYIEDKLSSPVDPKTGEMWINPQDLEYAYSHYENLKQDQKDPKNRKLWEYTQTALRKKLVKSFAGNSDLFKKELINRDLPNWLEQKGKWEEHKATIESFKKFTTYFSGFHENRKNMYSNEEQPTAIAYRLINENLPRFFNNYIQYKKMVDEYKDLKLTATPALLEKMRVESLDEIFKPRYFINLFTQTGIDNYQQLLGGKTEETGEKEQGLNEQVNLFKQQIQKQAKEHAKKSGEKATKIYDLSGFTGLYKQILSDRETTSFIPEAFDDDKRLLITLAEHIENVTKNNGLLNKLEEAIAQLASTDLQRVYIKSVGLTAISQNLFHRYQIINLALKYYAKKELSAKDCEIYLGQKAFSIAELDEKLISYIQSLEDNDPLHEQLKKLTMPQHPLQGYLLEAVKLAQTKQDNRPELNDAISEVKQLLSLDELSKNRKTPVKEGENGGVGFRQVQKIKGMLDGFMAVSDAVKPLHLVDGRNHIDMPDMDAGFYGGFSEAYNNYTEATITLYNKTRNHLTKKPFSTDKIKVNFGTPTLLNGWDVNKETDNSSILFEKDGLYYLGIMHPKHKHLFNYTKGIDDAGNDKKLKTKDTLNKKVTETDIGGYRKIVYKLLPGANKMLPKVFFSNKRIDYFSPSSEVRKIRNTASHSINGTPRPGFNKEDFSLEDCHTMIDFFKVSIKKHPEWTEFNFQFSDTNSYEDLSGFYREVESQGYRMDFHKIKESYINECIEAGKLFLFQIYNKDFSPYSKGNPNLHTLYWKGLFEAENLKDVVLKLNGEAEIFYRKHSIKRKDIITHTANEAIANKNSENPKKESTFAYDIVKDKRYTKDKFQLHVPITLNFKAQSVSRFNDHVNKALQGNSGTHIIGIDRGERHLLYYTVINDKGEIIEQNTLNSISTDQGYAVDYQQKLHTKEKQRDVARKSWGSVEDIKELKEGYLSHVVHKLAELIIKYNAIICLEDLNFGFKRGRFHVEKQVYQKFEKALIVKLNYLVFKQNEATKPGGYLNAYQLTAPFISFDKLGKQSGILFYVQAAYTSKIDPATGFINFLYTQYQSLAKSKQFFEAFESINFNSNKNYFEFSFDYNNFNVRQNLKDYQTKWIACTHGDVRYSNKRNQQGQWETISINVTEQLKALFNEASISYQNGQDLKQALASAKNTRFYKSLYWLIKLTLSLRHSVTGTDEDFILSPIADKNGVFFDSRNATKQQPKDADANGAYNIALKGLWNLQQIKQWDGEENLKLAMKNEDWFKFINDWHNK
ncbi:MAG: type V CRISPR-associated protein Cas12a/Cpf1 [Methylococcales symbiont of Iophon sp. n. MRB-2018]|nr:MAG: type V CRISPR-associated protein Cas12a/Cpf1 [Methylococcales symbiont of Iophon sp. n. MRB-2018]